MTISNPTSEAGPYTPNGVATQFAFGFLALSNAELSVEIDGITVNPSLYTVARSGEGGSVTFAVAPTGTALYIYGNPDLTQPLAADVAVMPGALEAALDRVAAGLLAVKRLASSGDPEAISGAVAAAIAPLVTTVGAKANAALDNVANDTFASKASASGVGGGVPATDAPTALATTAAVGSSAKFAREDHVHPLPTAPQVGAADTAFNSVSYVYTSNSFQDYRQIGTGVGAGKVDGGFWNVEMKGDNRKAASVYDFGRALYLVHTLDVPGHTGGRNSLEVLTNVFAGPDLSSQNYNYVSLVGNCQAKAPLAPGTTGALGAFFGGNMTISTGSTAQSSPNGEVMLNASCCEFDFFGGGAPMYGRSLLQFYITDGAKSAPNQGGFDTAFFIGGDSTKTADYGFDTGFHFAAHILNPTKGTVIKYGSADTILDGFNLAAANITRNVLSAAGGNVVLDSTGRLSLLNAAAGIVIGALNAPPSGTGQIKFRGGSGSDYDASITCGNNGVQTAGQASLLAFCSEFVTSRVRPITDNYYDLGGAGYRFATAYVATGAINTSDERQKEALQPIAGDAATALVMALKPTSWVWKDVDAPAKTETRTVSRQKTQAVEVEEHVASEADGQPVLVQRKTTVDAPVTQQIPVVDEAGQPVMQHRKVRVTDENGVGQTDASGKPITTWETIPLTHAVPVMEDVQETVELEPAQQLTFRRRHLGFTAQDVRQALTDTGWETDPDPTKSNHALFVYNADTDLYGLRPDQLIAVLTAMLQSEHTARLALETRVSALEAKA